MTRLSTLLITVILFSQQLPAQVKADRIFSFPFGNDITVTIDMPASNYDEIKGKTIIIFYALPNGNTTAQTMGRKLLPGNKPDPNIQHIRAQTKFIRQEMKKTNVVVIYLETDYHSWPTWKTKHADYIQRVQSLTDTIWNLFATPDKSLYLNGHSGGGRFIFSYLEGVQPIPDYVKRISFLDSDYGYDSSYLPKLSFWLKARDHYLNVFAYNDSIALYEGKPFVSATGGTWYRSHLMLKELGSFINFQKNRDDSITIYSGRDNRVEFFFKNNYDRGIYHTKQVELNGFIHSVFCGTRYDSENYKYYGDPAYNSLIE